MKTAVMTDTNSGITKQEADALGIFLIAALPSCTSWMVATLD